MSAVRCFLAGDPTALAAPALLADVLHDEDIGTRLAISAVTVRTHVHEASERLRPTTRTQAVATAVRLGLID